MYNQLSANLKKPLHNAVVFKCLSKVGFTRVWLLYGG